MRIADSRLASRGRDRRQIADERLKTVSLLTRLMRRPELGALAGLILVTIFFLFTANSSMFTLSGVMTILAPPRSSASSPSPPHC